VLQNGLLDLAPSSGAAPGTIVASVMLVTTRSA